jgi:hypothetical protein
MLPVLLGGLAARRPEVRRARHAQDFRGRRTADVADHGGGHLGVKEAGGEEECRDCAVVMVIGFLDRRLNRVGTFIAGVVLFQIFLVSTV